MLPAFTAVFSTGLLLGSYLPYFPLLTTVLLIGCALFPSAVERVPVRVPRGGVGLYAALLLGLLYWHGFAWIAPAVPIPDEQKSPARSYIGTVVEPVQHAQDRVTWCSDLILSWSRQPVLLVRDGYGSCGGNRVNRILEVTELNFKGFFERHTVR